MSNREKVIDWIRAGMNYNQGVSLLIEITHKPSFQNQFSGNPKHLASKLAYEICKASAVADLKTWKDFIDQHKIQPGANFESPLIPNNPVDQDELHEPSVQDTEQALLEDSGNEYPPIIRRVVHEYASLFQERSRLHQVMTGMPESNAETVRQKRAELFDMIKSLSSRLELLFQAKTLYDSKGVLPQEEILFPVIQEPAQIDLQTLDQETLKKRKKNLQNGNSKDQFMLDYQSQESKAIKNPMPEGPKRIKILYRISQRNKQILEIENALLSHVIKE